MDTKLLEEILSCPSLPSLPAVAIRVLELTSDPDVEMEELAKEIQFDQGIAAKILRTVNSSFYGLRKRCASIDHALVMLGLGPVKTLVLGFSLVDTVKGEEGDEFDYAGYWQRGLTSAIAAKFIAEHIGQKEVADEAFLAGLFQDIGMVAMHRTIGDDYLELMDEIEGDHSKLAKTELDQYEIQHSTIGALICEEWKMPHEIVIPVRYHDRPTACPTEFSQTTRCVAMGNLMHNVMNAEEPTEPLRRAYTMGTRWLGLKENEIDELIKSTVASTKDLANLFSIDVADLPDPEEALAKADRQLIELSKNQEIDGYAAKQFAALVEEGDHSDPLTGAVNREGFSTAVRDCYDLALNGKYSLSVVQMVLDGFDELGNSLGEEAQDEAVIGTSVLLRRHFEHMGGIVCRLSESIFAVVLPSVERAAATQSANLCCQEFEKRLPNWIPEVTNLEGCFKASIGLATLDDDTRGMMKSADLLVQAASRAVLAAKSANESTVRAFVPRKNAA